MRDLVFMLILTTICTVLLVVVDGIYQSRLAADPVLMRRALSLVGASLNANDDVKAIFDQTFEIVKKPDFSGSFFVGKKNSSLVVRQEEGSGLWGKIVLLLAYDTAQSTILGIDILEQSETPGSGARIVEENFRSQFRGLKAPHGVKAAKIKFKEGEFDGVSGATITSKAVEDIVNAAIQNIKKLNESSAISSGSKS